MHHTLPQTFAPRQTIIYPNRAHSSICQKSYAVGQGPYTRTDSAYPSHIDKSKKPRFRSYQPPPFHIDPPRIRSPEHLLPIPPQRLCAPQPDASRLRHIPLLSHPKKRVPCLQQQTALPTGKNTCPSTSHCTRFTPSETSPTLAPDLRLPTAHSMPSPDQTEHPTRQTTSSQPHKIPTPQNRAKRACVQPRQKIARPHPQQRLRPPPNLCVTYPIRATISTAPQPESGLLKR